MSANDDDNSYFDNSAEELHVHNSNSANDADDPNHGPDTVTNSALTDMVLDKHLPPPSTTAFHPSLDHITKVNQGAINRYEDLKLAHHVAEHGTGMASELQFRERLIQEEKLHQGDGSGSAVPPNLHGLTTNEANERLQQYGKNELPEIVESKLAIFLRQLFYAPMPIMIWIAIAILLVIGNILDAAILCFIQFTNALISFYEITKAGNAVAALKSSLRPTATCQRDGAWQVMDATLLVPGDTILLGSGSNVPADCRVNDLTASIEVDQAALTGESLPVTFYQGDSCKMGSTVVRGEAEVRSLPSFSWTALHHALFWCEIHSKFAHNFSFLVGDGGVHRCQYIFWENSNIVAKQFYRTNTFAENVDDNYVCVGRSFKCFMYN
jgi:E1-E2 ATPase/Cation transporter/ATPase, N-terminus